MVEEKICSRHGHVEGKEYSFGKAKFELGMKSCDHCVVDRREKRKIESSASYPVVSNNAVYAFLDGSEIVYIGSSKEASKRIRRHFNDNSGVFCEDINPLKRKLRFNWKILWYGDNGQDYYRLSQEKELIKLHKPKYNKTWVNES